SRRFMSLSGGRTSLSPDMVVLHREVPRLSEEVSVVSPSLAAQLEQCPLAVVFARDPAYLPISRRWSQFAALGDICHHLWELEGRREFDRLPEDDLGPALNAAWDESEARA